MNQVQSHRKPEDGHTHTDSAHCDCRPIPQATEQGIVWVHKNQDVSGVIEQAERIRVVACIMLQVEMEQMNPRPIFRFYPYASNDPIVYPPAYHRQKF